MKKWLVTRMVETEVFANTVSEAIKKSQKYSKMDVTQVHVEEGEEDSRLAGFRRGEDAD